MDASSKHTLVKDLKCEASLVCTFAEALRVWSVNRSKSISALGCTGDSEFMIIAHVCPFVGEQMGGSERYVYNLSKLQSKNHDVHIYTTTRHLDRTGHFSSDGITFHRFYSPQTIWNVNPLTFMLQSLVKSEADIFHVHSYLYTTSNQAVLAKILKQSKNLLQIHGGVGIPPYDIGITKLAAKHFYDRSLGKFTIKYSDLVASVSRNDLKEISRSYGIRNDKLRYVPNMVDTSFFTPRQQSHTEDGTILYLGDLEPWKGIGSLIRWIRAMARSNSQDVTFRIIGQGSYMSNLLGLRKSLQQSGSGISLEVLGPVNHEEVPRYLRSSSALVLPSYWEGMPTVVLEAMASGVPVISTKVGDVPSLLKNGETGFLIDRSLASFQEALNHILLDSDLTNSISCNARKLVEQEFSFSNASKAVTRVYSEICS